jgi:hypothetical protein
MITSGVSYSQENPGNLTGKVGNYSVFFLEKERVRHHRYELWLNQKTSYSFRFTSTIEARFRFDAAMLDDENATEQNIVDEVRDDELIEGDVRQAYFDYLGDFFRATAGIQKIDWVDSLSAATNDVLTPMDLRHGGFGDGADLIVPVGAATVNHKLFGGSLEWLAVPLPKSSKMGAGSNGYGFYEFVQQQIDEDITLKIENEEIPKGMKDTELGLRYMMTFEKAEFTLFGYRGHHRKPVFQVEETGDEEFTLTMVYPRTNTFGFFWSYADDAVVLRLMGFHEPKRSQQIIEVPNLLDEETYQTRSRAGLGFDYVFNKHLKVYTEQYYTVTTDYPIEDEADDSSSDDNSSDDDDTGLPLIAMSMLASDSDTREEDDRNPKNDYTAVVRLGNETFKTVEFSVDGVYQSPLNGHIVAPTAKILLGESWDLSLGARFVRSWHEKSAYEPIKKSSHVWSSIYMSF